MKMNRREKLITELALPIVEGLGFSLWGVHAPLAGKKAMVSVFIDTPGAVVSREGGPREERTGVNLDQCAQVSRDLGLAIEVEDAMPGAYRLEVSSPGLERRFFKLGQMSPYTGRKVKVELELPENGRKNFSATLVEVGEGFFIVEDDEQISHRIGWDQVKKARLVHEF